jgi:5-methylcytosine-specific restriction endonuclease McrA
MWKYFFDRLQGKAPKGAKRARGWRSMRKEHLECEPACVVCGGTKKIEVHHIVPFHLAPLMELHPANLMTLCERKKYGINCHLLMGHLGNYRKINQSVETDVIWMAAKLGKVK